LRPRRGPLRIPANGVKAECLEPSTTTSRVISKGIAAGRSQNAYRGLGARNFTNCDSLLIGNSCGAHTVPYIESKTPSAQFQHEATTSKISDDQLFYCMHAGYRLRKQR